MLFVAWSKYDENNLLDKLLGGHRLEFYKSSSCNLGEEEGRRLFDLDPWDTKTVPGNRSSLQFKKFKLKEYIN